MDELKAVRDLFGRATPPGEDVVRDRRSRLVAMARGAAPVDRRRPARRPLIAAVGLAAAAVTATLVVPTVLLDRPDDPAVLSGGPTGGTSPDRSPVPRPSRFRPLDRAIQHASDQAATPRAAYWRVRWLDDVRPGDEQPTILEGWLPSDRTSPVSIGSNRLGAPGGGKVGDATHFRWADPVGASTSMVLKLPADSGTLRDVLLDLIRGSSKDLGETDDALFTAAVALSTASPASPGARAAALRLIADLPDTQVGSTGTDPLGRPFVGVTHATSKYVLLLDPGTGAVLGSRVGGTYDLLLHAGWTDTEPVPPPSTL